MKENLLSCDLVRHLLLCIMLGNDSILIRRPASSGIIFSSSCVSPHQDVSHHFVSLLSGLDDPARSSLFGFTSVTVNDEIEQDDFHYTEYGHCIYPGMIGDHGLGRWGEGVDGRRGWKKEEGGERVQ